MGGTAPTARLYAVSSAMAASTASGIVKAAAHHAEHPWSAVADVQVGSAVVVVHAREATSKEVIDRLQERLRRQVERVVHVGTAARKPVAPPWRGGQAAENPASGSAGRAAAGSA